MTTAISNPLTVRLFTALVAAHGPTVGAQWLARLIEERGGGENGLEGLANFERELGRMRGDGSVHDFIGGLVADTRNLGGTELRDKIGALVSDYSLAAVRGEVERRVNIEAELAAR